MEGEEHLHYAACIWWLSPGRNENRILRIACRNIRAYIAGKPLENIVDRETGYKNKSIQDLQEKREHLSQGGLFSALICAIGHFYKSHLYKHICRPVVVTCLCLYWHVSHSPVHHGRQERYKVGSFADIYLHLFFFPLLRRGMAPILAGLLTALILLAVTIGLISGLNRKGFVTFLSTFGGVVTLGIAVLVFGWMTNLSGYNVENIENLMFAAQNTMIDVGQLLLAGILFTSLGAVMDIAMDVTSACAELVTHAEQLTRKELFWRIFRYIGP